MRALVQRVKHASVEVNGKVIGNIGHGLLLFLGIHKDDTEEQCDYLTKKVATLRIFEDENGKMNRSLLDAGSEILIVSQFTLYGDSSKGTRPSFTRAMEPARAKALYEAFIRSMSRYPLRVQTGEFQAQMNIHLENQGPVTILLEK